MEITEIRITLRDDEKLKAFASITLDNMIVIRGLKIIDGSSGTFIAMPSRQRKDGTYQDVAHPINRDTREWLEQQVIGAYKEEVRRAEEGLPPERRRADHDEHEDGLAAEDAY